jgi:hypothetical protein
VLSITGVAAASLIAGFGTAIYQRGIAIDQRDRAEQLAADVQDLSGSILDSFTGVASKLPAGRVAQQRLLEEATAVLDRSAERDDLSINGRIQLATRYIDLAYLAAGVRRSGLGSFADAEELLSRADQLLEGEKSDLASLQIARIHVCRGCQQSQRTRR